MLHTTTVRLYTSYMLTTGQKFPRYSPSLRIWD